MWIVYCLLCLTMWGLWGFFPKLAQQHFLKVEPDKSLVGLNAAVYQVVGSAALFLPIALIAVTVKAFVPGFFSRFDLANPRLLWEVRGVQYAMLAGITAALGGIFYQFAIGGKNVSIVVVITALYPLVTILLGWRLLGEHIQTRQWIGIVLALIAMALVAPTKE